MNPRKNDVLASNLLFASLIVAVIEQLCFAIYYYWDQTTYATFEPSIGKWAGGQLLWVLLQAAFYFAIRRGMFRAKVVVALGVLYVIYTHSRGWIAYLANLNFADLLNYSLVFLLKDLLMLAALMLMFTKPREKTA